MESNIATNTKAFFGNERNDLITEQTQCEISFKFIFSFWKRFLIQVFYGVLAPERCYINFYA